jgi:PAS domain S-box-containing protein
VLHDAARTVSLLVGDGCLIRVRDSDDGALRAVAAHHRRQESSDVLAEALLGPVLSAPGGWVGQALDRDCVLRLPESDAAALNQAGLPPTLPIADVIVVPIVVVNAVVIALRDRGQPVFSFADRLALERIAADAARDIVGAPSPGDLLSAGDSAAIEDLPAEMPSMTVDLLHLLDQTSAGLWLIDAEGVTTWVNEAASELVGLPARELVGARVPEFIAGADGALGGDLHAEHRSDRKLTRPDGIDVWLAATSRPLFDDQGKPAGTVLTLVDIDERKRREVDLRISLQASEALMGLAEISFDAPDLDAILAQSVRMVTEQLDTTLTSVCAVDVERKELRVLAIDGQNDPEWAEQLLTGGAIALTEDSVTLTAVRRGEPVLVGDFARGPIPPTIAGRDIRSGAFVPLGDGQSLFTAISRRPGALDGAALPLIESVARMIANYTALIGGMRHRGCADSSSSPFGRASAPAACELAPAGRHRRPRRRPGTA